MNIVLDTEQFHPQSVFFHDAVKNTVMDDSDFVRICYSNALFSLNGVLLKLHIRTSAVEKYFNKYKCSYDVGANREEICRVTGIEREILQRLNSRKRPNYRISEQLHTGNIKLFTDHVESKVPDEYILKISGVWETDTDYGLTYKFMDVGRQD